MKSYTNYIVNTKVLKANAINIKNSLKENTKLCAIVKANAYGLGLHTVTKTLQGVVDYFAVACIKEAVMLRVYDKITPILILGRVEVQDLNLCSINNISISITSFEQLKELISLHIPLNIHIQVNTGLNRFGIKSLVEYKKVVNAIINNKLLTLEGVYSHFATKSSDKVFIKKQFYKFNQFRNAFKIANVLYHIANSYAIICDKTLHLDMVRSGFLMYGNMLNEIGNVPVLSITSRIVHVFKGKKGDTIGYDRTYKLDKSTNIGVVPVGYADGFDRRLSNNFYVLVKGKKCRIVGLICMDCFMVELGNMQVKVGDEVVLIGKSYNNEITLNDYACAMNTSPYEVMLGFNYNRMNYVVK